MPHQTNVISPPQKRASKADRARKILAGAPSHKDDSDDSDDDLPWEWIYNSNKSQDEDQIAANELSDDSGEDENASATTPLKRRARHTRNASRWKERQIIGVKKGQSELRIGDCVVLKTHGTNDPWVGLIAKLMDDLTNVKVVNILCKPCKILPMISATDIDRVFIGKGYKK